MVKGLTDTTSKNNAHMKKDLTEIGKRIKRARKSKGINQVEFADKLNISVSHLSNIENGKINVGLDIFMAITEALEVSADWLLGIDSDSPLPLPDQVIQLFADCTDSEIQALLNVAREVKNSLRNQK